MALSTYRQNSINPSCFVKIQEDILIISPMMERPCPIGSPPWIASSVAAERGDSSGAT